MFSRSKRVVLFIVMVHFMWTPVGITFRSSHPWVTWRISSSLMVIPCSLDHFWCHKLRTVPFKPTLYFRRVKQCDEFGLQRNNQNFLDSGLWFLGFPSISNVQMCDDANERDSDEWVEALDWLILHPKHWALAVCYTLLLMINEVQHTS